MLLYVERYGEAVTFEDFAVGCAAGTAAAATSAHALRNAGGAIDAIRADPRWFWHGPDALDGEASDMRWMACIALSFMMFSGLTGCIRSYADLRYPEQRWMPGTN
jgi:hypothetical protein